MQKHIPKLLPLLLTAAFNAHAAKPVDVSSAQARVLPASADAHAADALGLARAELKAVRSHTYPNGTTITRFEQHHQGIPLWNESIVETRGPGKSAAALTGRVAKSIGDDLPSVKPTYSAADALLAAKTKIQQFATEYDRATLFIKLDKKNVAKLVYEVAFSLKGAAKPSSPHFIVDAHTGVVLEQWEGVAHYDASGPGGNTKTGTYQYGPGTAKGPLVVSSNCTMITTDPATGLNSVITVDLQGGTDDTVTTPYLFNCPSNTWHPVNGAQAPLNDVHYFANATVSMFKSWLGIRPVSQALVVRAHLGTNYENAYWHPTAQHVSFGDGGANMYPLTVLDIVGHEIAHGFTTQTSQLQANNGEPGAINEAFSDMAGEAVKFFVKGTNDFKSAGDAMKNTDAKRYLYNPPLDGNSRDNAFYYNFFDQVHYANGIYNKAFYLLATKPGWTTRKAFEVMADANRYYWTRQTTFNEGACGVEQAAMNRGYSGMDVRASFNNVGVVCGTHRMASEFLYLAMLGRPGDTNGLVNMANSLKASGASTDIAAFVDAYASNATIRSLVDGMGASGEANTLHGADNSIYVRNVFRYLTNREADAQRVSTWATAINNGSKTRGRVALDIINSTYFTTVDWDTAARKAAVAQYFTYDLDTSTEVSAYSGAVAAGKARSMLVNVTSTTNINTFQPTVKTTIAQIVSGQ